jgi:gas vesicle protein
MDWLKQLAPMLGTALGGPLGGAAASFIADKLGIENKTIEAVSEVLNSGKMTPEQVSALKLAEIEFEKFCKTNQLDLEKLSVQNTQGARDMQVATRSYIPGTLAVVITIGYLGILVGMMLGTLKVNDNQALLILVGALATGFGTVLNFFLGSSAGSQKKDDALAKR